ncbi:transcription factor MUTE-like [Typha latifolia]|uniref:transcription factor MUTE-like n=1 Tax=Typha latifolia TaxID=4733 RepID=UPI003C2D50C4
MGGDGLSILFENPHFRPSNLSRPTSQDDLFTLLESWEDATPAHLGIKRTREIDHEPGEDDGRQRKKTKCSASSERAVLGQHNKTTHIAVERSRRKQMNEHLVVLRSLMPNFYVKRGDQASIIGGVVDYIKELQQVLQSLEAKKQRKAYSEVLSPRAAASSSPRPPLSPKPLPLSPRLTTSPISPRTPQQRSPYKPRMMHQSHLYPTMTTSLESSTSMDNSKSPLDVKVKFSGSNVVLETVSNRTAGQVVKMAAVLEKLDLEILHLSINTVDDTMMYCFTIKIGIECKISLEELVQEIQQTFS